MNPNTLAAFAQTNSVVWRNALVNKLIEQCGRCIDVSKALAAFNKQFGNWSILGTLLDKHYDPIVNEAGRELAGPFTASCPDCHGAGYRLTDAGRGLLVLLGGVADLRPGTKSSAADSGEEENQ